MKTQHHIHFIRGAAAVIIVIILKAVLGVLFFGEPQFRLWIVALSFIVTVIGSYHYEKNLLIRFREWTKHGRKR